MSIRSVADAARLNALYRKYVASRGDIDLPRLVHAVRRETLMAEHGVTRVTPGLLRELRAERAEVGRLAKRRKR